MKCGKDKVIFCDCGVTYIYQVEGALETTLETFGGLDIVINNAGIINDRDWQIEVEVNLNGVVRGTLLTLSHMGKDRGGKGGIVVNIGSHCSLRPYISLPIYSAKKHSIIGLTRAFGNSYHLSMAGVKVFALCPGLTNTAVIKDTREELMSEDYENAWKRDTLTQKSEHVAKSLIQCLQSAPSGSI